MVETTLIYGDFREYRTIKTIDHKVNPEPHVSKGCNLHGKYCKAIFFTSEEEKREFTKSFNEMKMNNYGKSFFNFYFNI